MIDWSRIKGFDWDIGNSRKNETKHGVIQTEAEQAFFNEPLIETANLRHSLSEQRFHALGRTDLQRRIHLTFTLRHDGRLIRVISARDMSRKERSIYEQ